MEQDQIIVKIRAFLSGNNIPATQSNPKDDVSKDQRDTTRRNFTKADVEVVWETYLGGSSEGVCLLCNSNRIVKDDRSTWEMSHIEPHSLGGSSKLNNIRPLCFTCNRSMGALNLQTFVIERYPERYHIIFRLLKISK